MTQSGPSRRQVVKLGLGATLAAGLPTVVPAAHLLAASRDGLLPLASGAQGCCLRGSGAQALIARLKALSRDDADEALDEVLLERSGNERLDRAMGVMLADLASKLKVRPGFAYLDDGDAPNAFALDENWLPATRGTVLFGRNLLLSSLSRSRHGDMLVMGICAHEFGHIVQYDHDLIERLGKRQATSRRVELHADFLSGYYVGRRDVDYSQQQMIDLGRAWEELGDNHFTNPDHHGTSRERIAAIEAGYLMATQHKVGIQEAIQAGLYYLRA